MRLPATLTIFLLLAASFLPADVKLTIYDDGFSCPANCDAHVVFHRSMNGTKNAHAPNSAPGTFQKCTLNTECRICFDDAGQQCMNVMYRGAGPPRNTFDFTPAFYLKHCGQPSTPPLLAAKCNALKAQARTLDGRVNCIQNPDHPKCVDIIRVARKRQADDRPLFEKCKQLGEAEFNSGRPIREQRSEGCAYEKRGTGGPNSQGTTWKRLLPGACRDNTFVGRDGLDCCNGITIFDGPLGVECKGFYPLP